MVTTSLTSLVTAIWGGWMSLVGAGRECTVGRGWKASSLFIPAVLGTYFYAFNIATKWYTSNTGALRCGITVYFTVTGREMCRLLLITAHILNYSVLQYELVSLFFCRQRYGVLAVVAGSGTHSVHVWLAWRKTWDIFIDWNTPIHHGMAWHYIN